MGFRLLFDGATKRALDIEWTLDYPTAKMGPRGPSNAPRAERVERTVLPKATERFDQLLNLSSTNVPGTYNLRIRVENEVVLDRPFRLVLNRNDD
jgi:hypothetical protein